MKLLSVLTRACQRVKSSVDTGIIKKSNYFSGESEGNVRFLWRLRICALRLTLESLMANGVYFVPLNCQTQTRSGRACFDLDSGNQCLPLASTPVAQGEHC